MTSRNGDILKSLTGNNGTESEKSATRAYIEKLGFRDKPLRKQEIFDDGKVEYLISRYEFSGVKPVIVSVSKNGDPDGDLESWYIGGVYSSEMDACGTDDQLFELIDKSVSKVTTSEALKFLHTEFISYKQKMRLEYCREKNSEPEFHPEIDLDEFEIFSDH